MTVVGVDGCKAGWVAGNSGHGAPGAATLLGDDVPDHATRANSKPLRVAAGLVEPLPDRLSGSVAKHPVLQN